DQGDQERDAPAPRLEVLGGHPGPARSDDDQGQEESQRGGGLDPARGVAAAALRRVLGDVGGGASVLAAQRQTLQQTQADQQERGEQAHRGVGRQQADREGRR